MGENYKMKRLTRQENKVLDLTSKLKALLRCEINEIKDLEKKILKHKLDEWGLVTEDIFLTSFFLELMKVIKAKGRK